MDRNEFVSTFKHLTDELGGDMRNVTCLNSSAMRASTRCMFSKNLDSCYCCTHCEDCNNSANLAQSSLCSWCNESAYLVNCQYCSRSAYLIRCVSCNDCNYCFGCVGLDKRDFHILNVPYSRKEYFEIVKSLKSQLGLH